MFIIVLTTAVCCRKCKSYSKKNTSGIKRQQTYGLRERVLSSISGINRSFLRFYAVRLRSPRNKET